jgi:hypothetical protein
MGTNAKAIPAITKDLAFFAIASRFQTALLALYSTTFPSPRWRSVMSQPSRFPADTIR